MTTSTVTSKTYFSNHMVTGVQFATSQSPPKQLVTDDDLIDPALGGSTWSSTDGWHRTGDANIFYNPRNTSAIISRVVTPTPIEFTLPLNSIVVPPVFPVFDERTGDSGAPPTPDFGGIISGLIHPSGGGRIYIAVRFTALTDFTQPVFVQLINGDDDSIVQQWQVSPILNQAVEQYWHYDIGSIVSASTNLRVGMYQAGKTNDSWSLDTLSVFDEGLVWSFSVNGGVSWFKDLGGRNLASGVVRFPVPGNQLRWRATAYRTGIHINHLRMRPIYEHVLSSRPEGIMRGPNISPFDHEPDVFNDPLFNGWDKPIPQWWFSAFKNQVNLFPDGAPVITSFQRFYERPVTDDLSGSFSDAATANVTHNSFSYDYFNVYYPISDVASRTATYTRATPDTIPTPTDHATGIVTHPDLVSPMVAPVPSNPTGPPLRS